MTRAAILVQALSGKGKTFWAATGGKPYILAAEPKCRNIVKILNPDAMVFDLDTAKDYENALRLVQDPRLVEKGYTRIVLDSFSELTEFIPEWFGMPFPLQIQDYGTIGNKAMALVRAMLMAPIPVIVIARSESKEQGKVHRIVPGSLGKSAGSLPSKLVLTAETRHDEQLGWIVDTTPDDYTQRSGLPWVPQLFQGQADEFLALVEAGPAAAVKPAAPAPVPAQPRPTRPRAQAAPEPAPAAATPTPAEAAAFVADLQADATDRALGTKISPAAAAFVEGVSPSPKAKPEDVTELLDLTRTHKVDTKALYAYLVGRGDAVAGESCDWTSVTAAAVSQLVPILREETRRRGLQAHLANNYAATA